MTPSALLGAVVAVCLVLSGPLPHGRGDDRHPAIGDPPAQAFLTTLGAALELASHEQRPLVVHFTRGSHRESQRVLTEVYRRPPLRDRLARFIRVAVDLDRDPDGGDRFEVRSVPTVVFLRSDGVEVPELRVVGVRSEAAMAAALDRAVETLRAPAMPARERAARHPAGASGLPGTARLPPRPAPPPAAPVPAAATEPEAPSSEWLVGVLGLLGLLAAVGVTVAIRRRAGAASPP